MQESHTLQLIFTIAVVASIVIQGLVFLGLFVAVAAALKKLTAISESLQMKAAPIISGVQGVVQDLTPKIRTISSQVVEMTGSLRDQTKHVNSTVDEVVDKTRAQAGRVDEMVSAVLGSLSHAGVTVQSGVARPARVVGGVLHGIRVAVESFLDGKAEVRTSSTRVAANAVAAAEPVRAEPSPVAGREGSPLS